MKCMKYLRILFSIGLLLPVSAFAQSAPSNPAMTYGMVPTVGQWNNWFQHKQDTLGFTPVNRAGDTMLGPLKTTGSTASNSGFSILTGIAPNVPNNGDIWVTSSGLYYQAGNITFGPVGAGTIVGPGSSLVGHVATFGNTSGTSLLDSGKTLPSGAIVGTTDSQTLPNKTLPSPIITSGASFNGSSSGATILQSSAVASGTLTLPASTDTLMGVNTAASPTNKTFDTAGAGNVFKINGTQISSITGTGSVVLSNAPALTSPTMNAFQVGTAQTSVGQIGQITAPYTSSGLNTTTDIFRVQVGPVDPTFEVGQGSASTAGITCALATPSGSYSGIATWPDSCGNFYGISYNTNKSTVAIYSLGAIGATNGFAEGINSSTVNCAGTSCTGTTGLDFRIMYTAEFDTNVYSKSGAAPAGDAAGVVSILNATIQNTGSLSAYLTSHTPGMAQWKTAFASNHGDAAIGISLGAVASTPTSNSQPINLTALDSSGNPQLGKMFTDSLGTLNLQVPNTTLQLAQTYPYMTLNQTLAGAAGAKFVNASTNSSANENLIVQSGSYYGVLQTLSTGAFSIQTSPATNLQLVPGTGAYVVLGGKNTIVSAWPTSCSGLVSGSLYSNSGVINVCP